MKIPFDSLCLAAVVQECQPFVGGRIQKVLLAAPNELAVAIYKEREQYLLLSADPQFARAHWIARRPEGMDATPALTLFRRYLKEAKVAFVRQRGLDRVLEIGADGPEGPVVLVAELMGKHANVMLVAEDRRVVAALKWIGPKLSRRPILPGQPYEAPPLPDRPPFTEAKPGDDLNDYEGASPFLQRLIQAGYPLADAQARVREGRYETLAFPGHGAYPLPLDVLNLVGYPRLTLSTALEAHFAEAQRDRDLALRKQRMQNPLQRVADARRVAVREIREAVRAARDVPTQQMWGELILAYQYQATPGAKTLDVMDYEGREISIPLKTDLTPLENAQRYFDKAKRVKSRAAAMAEQEVRIARDLEEVEGLLLRLERALDPAELDAIEAEIDRRRWRHRAPAPTRRKEERPFAGHAVREMLSPGGYRVLYGETATANDYLTTKVARPSDYWFHVRGGGGAHVVLMTMNQPQRVQMPDLIYAAQLAKRHSSQKHSGYVSVDYTLKKYVRKPRGSAPGLAVYTHEKTLHLEE